MIVIVDYGMGNLRSLMNAFDFLGQDVQISRNPEDFADADRIVLPGVGAFRDAIRAIRDLDLERPLTDQAIVVRKPILGVCLGMQLLAKVSHEYGEHSGLGWIDAHVNPLESTATAKVPQVGWNEITVTGAEWMFKGLPKASDFYFVHSFHMECEDPSDVIATTDHNGPITAAVARDNIVAAQFHPEKSQDNGLQFLQNWLDWDFK